MGRAGRTGHGAQRARDGVDGQPIRTGQVAKHRPMRGGLGVTGGGSWRPSPAHRRSGRLPCSPPRSPVAGTGRSPGRLPAAVAVHNAGLGARRILVESCAQDTQDLAALTGALAHIGAPTTVRARVDRRHAHELRWDGDLIAYADTAGGQLRRERLGGHRGAVRQRSAKDSGPLPPPCPAPRIRECPRDPGSDRHRDTGRSPTRTPRMLDTTRYQRSRRHLQRGSPYPPGRPVPRRRGVKRRVTWARTSEGTVRARERHYPEPTSPDLPTSPQNKPFGLLPLASLPVTETRAVSASRRPEPGPPSGGRAVETRTRLWASACRGGGDPGVDRDAVAAGDPDRGIDQLATVRERNERLGAVGVLRACRPRGHDSVSVGARSVLERRYGVLHAAGRGSRP